MSLDNLETGAHTSSMVDDIFFIVKKCTRYVQLLNNSDLGCSVKIDQVQEKMPYLSNVLLKG